MTQIRTAEEVAKEMFEVSMDKDTSILVLPDELIKAMQEYAKQFIDLAAEQTDYCVLRELSNGADAVERNQIEEKILKIKDLIK